MRCSCDDPRGTCNPPYTVHRSECSLQTLLALNSNLAILAAQIPRQTSESIRQLQSKKQLPPSCDASVQPSKPPKPPKPPSVDLSLASFSRNWDELGRPAHRQGCKDFPRLETIGWERIAEVAASLCRNISGQGEHESGWKRRAAAESHHMHQRLRAVRDSLARFCCFQGEGN